MSLTKQSLFIAGAFLAVFIWHSLPLSDLTTPVIGLLVLIYLLLLRRSNKSKPSEKSLGGMDALSLSILISLVLLLILVTGAINSPLYFLLYFVPFAITFVLLPKTTFVFLAGSILLLLSSALEANVTENMIKLGSLVLITPLAYFFGKEYRLVEEHGRHDTQIADQISREAATVLRDQGSSMTTKDKDELTNIIVQTEELKE
jgi:hypothetical protein